MSEAGEAPIDAVVSENNRLAFARSGKGFFALNNGNGIWSLYDFTTF